MTVDELLAQFPEIPKDLRSEPLLIEYANAFGNLLDVARKPSACVKDRDAEHVFYMKLVADLEIYGLGLAKRDKTLARLQDILEQYKKNPATFGCSLVPERPQSASHSSAPRAGISLEQSRGGCS